MISHFKWIFMYKTQMFHTADVLVTIKETDGLNILCTYHLNSLPLKWLQINKNKILYLPPPCKKTFLTNEKIEFSIHRLANPHVQNSNRSSSHPITCGAIPPERRKMHNSPLYNPDKGAKEWTRLTTETDVKSSKLDWGGGRELFFPRLFLLG